MSNLFKRKYRNNRNHHYEEVRTCVCVCVAKRTTTNIDKMVKFIENYYYYCHY